MPPGVATLFLKHKCKTMEKLIEQISEITEAKTATYWLRLENLLMIIDEIDPTIADRIKLDENGNPKKK